MSLLEIEHIPSGLLDLESAAQLHTIHEQPFLMHLKGQREDTLFTSVILHGNEDTGFLALRNLLRDYQNRALPRSLSVFFGNIEAARQGVRRLEGQPDYNRVWPGTDIDDCYEKRLMAEVVERLQHRPLLASIDVHNNTGRNPHYGCVNVLEPQFLQLAALFSRTVVFFQNPRGVQSMAMANYCPAVTLECGKPHLPHGVQHAQDYLEAVLHMADIPSAPVPTSDIDLFHTVARITIPEQCSFSFTDDQVDIRLTEEIDHYNFNEVPAGTVFGRVGRDCQAGFHAWNDAQQDCGSEYFSVNDSVLSLNKSMMPAMLTLDEKIIRQDCLCYLMERLHL